MKDYRRVRLLVLLLLGLYFIAGLTTKPVTGREIFPFFPWFLFSEVPETKDIYDVRIYEYNGDSFDPPLYYSEAKNLVPKNPLPRVHNLIQTLGNSLGKNQIEESEKLRIFFELNYLPGKARY